MKDKNMKVLLATCVITLAFSSIVSGQDGVVLSVAPSTVRALDNGGIAEDSS